MKVFPKVLTKTKVFSNDENHMHNPSGSADKLKLNFKKVIS